jgi:hypothetical protein
LRGEADLLEIALAVGVFAVRKQKRLYGNGELQLVIEGIEVVALALSGVVLVKNQIRVAQLQGLGGLEPLVHILGHFVLIKKPCKLSLGSFEPNSGRGFP